MRPGIKVSTTAPRAFCKRCFAVVYMSPREVRSVHEGKLAEVTCGSCNKSVAIEKRKGVGDGGRQ